MRTLLLLTLASAALPAATIRGVVLENLSGHPLMRAVVVIAPVAGGSGTALSARTNRYGSFEFPPLPPGAYLVSASRPGFAPAEYGQKEWRAAGVPVRLSDTDDTFLNIRMKRFGAIAGTVVDENEVGLPDVTVVAYRNTRPPELVAKALTDDRGMYRIFGLEPGIYIVRSTAKEYGHFSGEKFRTVEDAGYLPTFSRQTGRVDEAMPIEVRLDDQADNSNVKPEPGRLLTIGGVVYAYSPSPDAPPVTLTLVSDMGRESVTTSGEFHFNPVAPGSYELFAEGPPDRRGNRVAGYMPLSMDRDRPDIRFPLASMQYASFRVQDSSGKSVDAHDIKIQARRRDLAGPGTVQMLDPRAQLIAPGPWELSIAPRPDYYVSDFSGPGYQRSPQHPPDGWNSVILGSSLGNSVTFVLTAGPGSLQGTVNGSSAAAVQGAPVFLESYDPREQRRRKEIVTVRTDTMGHYQFIGLAPGTYRVFSSFDYQSPDEAAMERANPRAVTIEGGRAQVQDLDLYEIR